MNIVTLTGNVGQEPKITTFNDGGKVANISLATSRRWTNSRTGEKQEKTEWHAIKITNEKLVDVVERFVNRGDKIGIIGTIEYREFEKDGVKRWATDIIVGFNGQVELLGGRKESEPGTPARTSGAAPQHHSQQPAAGLDDDIPF